MAADLCETAFLVPPESSPGNRLPGPILILRNTLYYDSGWELERSNWPYLMITNDPSTMAAVVCVSEDKQSVGQYIDGQPAYRIVWEVRVIRWPGGEVMTANHFVGSEPPRTKIGSGPGWGGQPYNELAEWLHSLTPPRQEQVMVLTVPTDKTYTVTGVAFSPDGKILASTHEEGAVRLWEVASGQVIKQIDSAAWARGIAFSPDGELLAWCNKDNVTLWEVETQSKFATISEDQGAALAFSPNGELLALARWDGTIRLWDITKSREVAIFTGHAYAIADVAFSPDGKILASGSNDDTVKLWRVETGDQIVTLTHQTEDVQSVAFSPDGRLLAWGGLHGIAILWDLTTNGVALTLPHNIPWIYKVAFSPDGRLLATGDPDGRIWLWQVSTGETVASFAGHTGSISDLAFSPDGKLLASSSEDGSIILWRVPGP